MKHVIKYLMEIQVQNIDFYIQLFIFGFKYFKLEKRIIHFEPSL